MSGYIGAQPVPQATQHREAFTATASQTSFATVGYTPQFVDVYLNGVKLAAADYTATNGSDIVLTTGAALDDILEYVAYTPFEVASQTFTGTTTVDVLSVTGAFTSLGIDDNATSTAMTLDSSGNVLVGTTNSIAYSTSTTSGAGLNANGTVFGSNTTAGGIFNRRTTDGEIVSFRKDGTTVGSIGYNGAQPYMVSANGAGFCAGGPSSAILPTDGSGNTIDNSKDVGSGTVRFDDIFATNGTIATSDRNEKEAIASLTPAEMLVAARLSSSFKNFKWKDAVAEKGLDAARLHSGIIAQDVQDAFTAEGLDAGDYAMFISSTWWETQTDVPAVEAVAEVVDEEGNVVTEAVEAKEAYTRTDIYHTLEEAPEGATERTRLGVRYPELLAFVAAYNDQRFLAIEARLTALEANGAMQVAQRGTKGTHPALGTSSYPSVDRWRFNVDSGGSVLSVDQSTDVPNGFSKSLYLSPDITAAQYVALDGRSVSIQATIDGQEMSVPMDPANRHYAEIMRQVEAGTLVVLAAAV